MKYSYICYLIFYFALCIPSFGIPKCHIEHYSLADGLPQRSIMHIIQDKKGFIWLATWDGLCKFDGYNFTTYKPSAKDSIYIQNNRIDYIHEDSLGYLWVRTYNKESFRFDPASEQYVAAFGLNGKPFYTTQICPAPSGRVWLNSTKMGAICILDRKNNYKSFTVENHKLLSNCVNGVYEDRNKYSWILTNNGLLQISPTFDKYESFPVYFSPRNGTKKERPFFCALETNNEIWFGSGEGSIWCYNKDDNKFTAYQLGIRSNVISIKKLYNNTFVILTSDDGFFICDESKTIIKQINTNTYKGLPSNEMISCHIDNSNNIWLQTNSIGVTKFNLEKNILKHYPPLDFGDNTILYPAFFVIEDKSNEIWTHPHRGFSYYDKQSDRFLPFFNNPRSTDWKFSDILHYAFLDKQGNIWLSPRSGGLEKIVFDNTLFSLNCFSPKNSPIATNDEVRAIFEDSDYHLWTGNKNGLISVYDANRNLKGFLCKDGSISKTGDPLKTMAAYTFCQDHKGNIWIGTKGLGIYILTPSTTSSTKFSIQHYKNDINNPFSLSDNAVYSIHEDQNHQIWIGTYGGGLNLFEEENNRFINHKNRMRNYPIDTGSKIRFITSRKNILYVATTLGLIAFRSDLKTWNNKDFYFYSKTHKEKDGLKSSDIYHLYVTKSNDLYIATFGGGISRVSSYNKAGFPTSFKTYDSANGLHSDIVLSIIEDNNNKLWLNSEGNLSKFDPQTKTFDLYNDVNQVIGDQFFSEASPVLTKDGEIIYGYTYGTISFIPDKISRNNYTPYLALNKLNVSGKKSSLKKRIDNTDKIILKHDENTFSIEYTALDYTSPKDILYSYMLEGFDKDWTIGHQRFANYTNIPPGRYTFRIKSTNSNGSWVNNERTLSIIIKPSFWQTQIAYLIYLITFIFILYVILRYIFIFYRMRDKIRLEHEQTEMKTRFFTDISHEIRTPLSMIVSPLENIISDNSISERIRPQLLLMQRNVDRMVKMVNQILDFRKIQKQKLHIQEISIGDYIHELYSVSKENSIYPEINFSVNNQTKDTRIWGDTDSIEKLVFNLISNSIKYTSKEKSIEINIFRKDKTVALQIKDEGIGMTKDVLNKLFVRFASFNTDKSKPSTGIGLSIVKEVADKHHARIEVESELYKGTCFTVFFQTGLDHFKNDQNVDIILSQRHPDKFENPSGSKPNISYLRNTNTGSSDNESSILIVEDDDELRTFIVSVLSPYYKVYEAKDGKDGYNKAIKDNPDFILSDIMMPEMDGIDFLRAIRNNENTSHIPFILLTAKSSTQDKLTGTISGADDYITKPFSTNLLIAKINNIIQQRQRLSDHLTNYKSCPEIKNNDYTVEDNITEQDKLFLKNLQEDIESQIDNSDFVIDDLVSKTNLSRRVFFNKVKSLTGLAPVEFVRTIRLKRSALLLKESQYRIKEIIYMVGFSDIRYFTQCFKKTFDMTPSQYREQFKKK